MVDYTKAWIIVNRGNIDLVLLFTGAAALLALDLYFNQ